MYALQKYWDTNKSFDTIEFFPFQNVPDWLLEHDKALLLHAKNNGLNSLNNSFTTSILNYKADSLPSRARLHTRLNMLIKPMVDAIYKLNDIQNVKSKRATKISEKATNLTKAIKKSIQQSLLIFKAPSNDAELAHISKSLKMELSKFDPTAIKEYYKLLLSEAEDFKRSNIPKETRELSDTYSLKIVDRQKLLTRIDKLVNSDAFQTKKVVSIQQTQEKLQKRFVPPEDYDLLIGISTYGFGLASFKLMQEDLDLQLFKKTDALPKESIMEVRAASIVSDISKEIENGGKLKSIEKTKLKPLSLVAEVTPKKAKKLLEFDNIINLDNDFENTKMKSNSGLQSRFAENFSKSRLISLSGGITIHSFGKLSSCSMQQDGFIYPVGFRSSRTAPSYSI